VFVLLVWSGNDKYSRADVDEINLRVEREVTRAKGRDVFAHMMAATKDPSKQLPEPTPGKLARPRAVRITKSTNTARGRGKETNKRISKTHASVFSTSLPMTLCPVIPMNVYRVSETYGGVSESTVLTLRPQRHTGQREQAVL
jgi:hypothetical protein